MVVEVVEQQDSLTWALEGGVDYPVGEELPSSIKEWP